jgi:hypothetical protein
VGWGERVTGKSHPPIVGVSSCESRVSGWGRRGASRKGEANLFAARGHAEALLVDDVAAHGRRADVEGCDVPHPDRHDRTSRQQLAREEPQESTSRLIGACELPANCCRATEEFGPSPREPRSAYFPLSLSLGRAHSYSFLPSGARDSLRRQGRGRAEGGW